jgi:hypothetical protein
MIGSATLRLQLLRADANHGPLLTSAFVVGDEPNCDRYDRCFSARSEPAGYSAAASARSPPMYHSSRGSKLS